MTTETVGRRVHTVEIAAKLYDCRDTVRRFLRDGYRQRMEEIGENIKKVARMKGCDELKAVHALAENCDAMGRIFLLAAYVELVEPSIDLAPENQEPPTVP